MSAVLLLQIHCVWMLVYGVMVLHIWTVTYLDNCFISKRRMVTYLDENLMPIRCALQIWTTVIIWTVTYRYIMYRDSNIRYDMAFYYHGKGAICNWGFRVISWKISTWSAALSTSVLRTEHMKSRISSPSGKPSQWRRHCAHATDGPMKNVLPMYHKSIYPELINISIYLCIGYHSQCSADFTIHPLMIDRPINLIIQDLSSHDQHTIQHDHFLLPFPHSGDYMNAWMLHGRDVRNWSVTEANDIY